MKFFEWPMLLFVGITLVHEFWIFSGLPQIHYWDLKQNQCTDEDHKNNNKAA